MLLLRFLPLISLLTVCLSGCSTFRYFRVQECEKALLLIDEQMFGFDEVRNCLCEAREDGLKEKAAFERCDAECVTGLAKLSKFHFYSEPFTRCVCDGIKRKADQKADYERCMAEFPRG